MTEEAKSHVSVKPPEDVRSAVPSAEGLAAAASRAGAKGPPPVHLWDPPFCGDLDIEIRRDGTWFYLGTPIGRPALVKLFASILKREDGRYFLVTPVEKVGIRVQDAPFVAVDCTASDGDLRFETNVGDTVTAGAEHPIRVSFAADGTPRPYVHIRRGLEALIDRKTFYRLVDLAQPGRQDGAEWLGLTSGRVFFPLLPMADL